jgi:hypothetical protein
MVADPSCTLSREDPGDKIIAFLKPFQHTSTQTKFQIVLHSAIQVQYLRPLGTALPRLTVPVFEAVDAALFAPSGTPDPTGFLTVAAALFAPSGIPDPTGFFAAKLDEGSLVTDPEVGSLLTPDEAGSLFTPGPDGSFLTPGPDGSRLTLEPDGSRLTLEPDGRRLTLEPDGSLLTPGPEGRLCTPDPDEALLAGTDFGTVPFAAFLLAAGFGAGNAFCFGGAAGALYMLCPKAFLPPIEVLDNPKGLLAVAALAPGALA